jgi:hypothetical protein
LPDGETFVGNTDSVSGLELAARLRRDAARPPLRQVEYMALSPHGDELLSVSSAPARAIANVNARRGWNRAPAGNITTLSPTKLRRQPGYLRSRLVPARPDVYRRQL